VTIRVLYKTSMADLLDVGEALFSEMRECFEGVDWSLPWAEQPQETQSRVCRVLALARNRTAPPVNWTPPAVPEDDQ
jgi:hypothetical protein